MASTGVSHTGAYGTASIGAAAGAITDGTPTRKSILIQNVHAANDLYVGTNASVLTTTGIKIVAGASLEISDYNGPVYGIASAAGTDVRYLEVGA